MKSGAEQIVCADRVRHTIFRPGFIFVSEADARKRLISLGRLAIR